jgi:hypothetical protein
MLKGQANLLGNVEPGNAVLDERTGQTLYKLNYGATHNGQEVNAINVDVMRWVKLPNDRPVHVMSQKLTAIVKEEILKTPGWRGLLI